MIAYLLDNNVVISQVLSNYEVNQKEGIHIYLEIREMQLCKACQTWGNLPAIGAATTMCIRYKSTFINLSMLNFEIHKLLS